MKFQRIKPGKYIAENGMVIRRYKPYEMDDERYWLNTDVWYVLKDDKILTRCRTLAEAKQFIIRS